MFSEDLKNFKQLYKSHLELLKASKTDNLNIISTTYKNFVIDEERYFAMNEQLVAKMAELIDKHRTLLAQLYQTNQLSFGEMQITYIDNMLGLTAPLVNVYSFILTAPYVGSIKVEYRLKEDKLFSVNYLSLMSKDRTKQLGYKLNILAAASLLNRLYRPLAGASLYPSVPNSPFIALEELNDARWVNDTPANLIKRLSALFTKRQQPANTIVVRAGMFPQNRSKERLYR